MKKPRKAIFRVLKRASLNKDFITVQSIAHCQQQIKALRANTTLAAAERDRHINAYRAELQKYRRNLRRLRKQSYIVEVFLPEFNKAQKLEMVVDDMTPFREAAKKAIEQAVSVCRNERKMRPTIARFADIAVERSGLPKKGWVFIKEGQVLQAHIHKNLKNLYENKAPDAPKKYIGIELEFCAPIKEGEFAVKLFQNGIHKYAQLKNDGSLRPKEKENGFELAILLEEGNYKKPLKKIIDVLTSVKAVAKDRRAGLHVHLDMRRRDKDLVYNNLVACQYALLSIVDPSRYDNEFCRVVETRKFPTEFTGERHERYKTINAAAYYKYRTLEVRMHEGSVDYAQICNWVDLLVKIANYSKRMKYNVNKVPLMHKKLKLSKKLYNYVLDRSCTFQLQQPQEQREGLNARLERLTRQTRAELERTGDVVTPRPMRVEMPTATFTAAPDWALTTNMTNDNLDATDLTQAWLDETDEAPAPVAPDVAARIR